MSDLKAIEEQARKEAEAMYPFVRKEDHGPLLASMVNEKQNLQRNAYFAALISERTRAGEERWIPVTKSTALPAEGESVMTFTPHDHPRMRYRIIAYGSIGGGFPSEVTHFQPLPDPPSTDPR